MEIENKVVLVTGAGSGIGRAIALACGMENPSAVICVDKNTANVEKTVSQLRETKTTAYAETIDLTDLSAIADLGEKVLKRHGVVDILFSNAGVSFAGDLETSEEDWETSWNVNLMAQVRTAKALLPAMISNGGGYIVNTASAAGLLTNLGALSYAVTKHASVALSEWIAINHRPDNIRVSVLCPMGVRTNMLFPDDDRTASSKAESLAQRAVLDAGDILDPSQVAEVVIAAVKAEEFLILPHKDVLGFYSFRANNTQKWITSMAKYQEQISK
ncbi:MULTISPECIES: SDR family oxidoreductase [Acidithrix]|uniref:Putative ketoacyl reductase n=1 Tax=Acidithrix ferrooxidans TaxID=1280514 RepID=A0A0D8HMK1_9ACTN|nr:MULTISPECIES: SDR family oxidoreductase [Acidithrix]KJF18321.1 putative ketoacyl reductase [Acidithrix ferrooxidans]CAG4921319.1 unnamed protein product [Acidithrix sp. C25]